MNNNYTMNADEQEMYNLLKEEFKKKDRDLDTAIQLRMNVRGETFGKALEKLFEQI